MIIKNIEKFFIYITVFILFILPTVQANDTSVYSSNAFSLGIVPQQAIKKIHTLWEPFTKYIQQQTNYPVHLYGSPDIPTYENRLFSGKFDLAYVNPRSFLQASKYVGYLPIAREANKKLRGIIVVAKDSPYQSINDLNNIHFVSPKGAFAASALTRIHLYNLELNVKNSFVDTHSQGYSLVATGAVDAAGGVMRTFNNLPAKIKNKLKILWTSKGVAPHAFIIHPRVNKTVRQRITEAIIRFKDTPEGVAFYKSLNLNPFVAAQSKDWDDVRQLMEM